jgi:hypothetical protein
VGWIGTSSCGTPLPVARIVLRPFVPFSDLNVAHIAEIPGTSQPVNVFPGKSAFK